MRTAFLTLLGISTLIYCTVYGPSALADEASERQIAESALRQARDIISSELFGHYDLTELVVRKVEAFPDRVRRGPDHGLVTVTLGFSSKRNATKHPSLNAAMFEPGNAMCQGWLYLHCGVAVGHVFDGRLQILLAVDRAGSCRPTGAPGGNMRCRATCCWKGAKRKGMCCSRSSGSTGLVDLGARRTTSR